MSNSKLSYAERVALKRARRLNPTPQAVAARQRAAMRNREAARLRDDSLNVKVLQGDPVAAHLLEAK